MSIETNYIPPEAEQFEAEPKEESPEVKRSLNIFRGKIMKAAMLTGMLAMIEACGGMREEEVQQIPKTSIADLEKDPLKYTEMPMIQTEAYPIFERRQRDSTITYGPTGFGTADEIKDYYRLIEGPEKSETGGVEAYLDKGTEAQLFHRLGNIALDALNKRNPDLKVHRFRFVGHMKETKGKPVFEIYQSLDLDQPVEKPENIK